MKDHVFEMHLMLLKYCANFIFGKKVSHKKPEIKFLNVKNKNVELMSC